MCLFLALFALIVAFPNLSNAKLDIYAPLSRYILPSVLPQHNFRDLWHHIARQPTPGSILLLPFPPRMTAPSCPFLGQYPRHDYPAAVSCSPSSWRLSISFRPKQTIIGHTTSHEFDDAESDHVVWFAHYLIRFNDDVPVCRMSFL